MLRKNMHSIVSGCFVCVLVIGQSAAAQNLESLPDLERISPRREQSENLRPDQLGKLNQRRKRPISFNEWLAAKFGPDVYKPDSGDDELTRLKKERINACLVETGHFKRLESAGVESLDLGLKSQERLFEAQLDFHAKPKEIIAVLERAVETAKLSEAIVKDQYDAGAEANIAEVSRSKYFRLDCEIRLLKAKQKYGLVEDSAVKKKGK